MKYSDKKQIIETAIRTARAQGCTCRVEIEVIRAMPFPEVNVKHDDDCPLLRAVDSGRKGRDQFIIDFRP